MATRVQQLRDQMSTATDLQSVVQTMRALAEVNVRRSEGVARDFALYARSVHMALYVVLRALARERRRDPGRLRAEAGRDAMAGEFASRGRDERTLPGAASRELVAVVITSDQGLCGPFNDRIISYALDYVRRAAPDRKDRRLVTVGYRGYERLHVARESIVAHCDGAGSLEAIPSVVSQLLIALADRLRSPRPWRLVVIGNRPQSGGGFQEGHVQLIPLDIRRWSSLPEGESPFRTVPQHDLAPRELLPHLVREQLYVDLFQSLVNSFIAENGARLSAMRTASENISERLEELEAEYRRERQEWVTQELMDVMGGVEAVNPDEERREAPEEPRAGRRCGEPILGGSLNEAY